MLLNKTLIQWVSKRQPAVETSTHGSELIATRIAIDINIEMRYKLRMLRIPVENPHLLLGDNMSVVVLSTTIPSSPLKKKHLARAYHMICEAVTGSIVEYAHVSSKENVADIFTKPLTKGPFLDLVKQYLFRHAKFYNKENKVKGQVKDMIEGE